MWSQLKGALRNLIVFPLVITTGLIVYSIFLLRGRDVACEGPLDPLWRLACSVGTAETDNTLQSKHLTYDLSKLPEDNYERKITNHSWRPFFITMYAFENWQYTLPDERLLRYASRYVVRNTRTDLEIDSGTGFYCGTGLGMTLIRPWETFVDTVSFEELVPHVYIRHQLKHLDAGYAYDLLTGTRIGNPLEEHNQYEEASLLKMAPDDELEVRLYLPVTDYFTGEPARAYANAFTVGRWQLLEQEIARRAKIEAEFVD